MKNGWVTTRIGEIAKTQYGLSVSMNKDGKGFKIFRMGEVQHGRLFDTGRMKYADISAKEFEQYKLRTGDVLFNRTNSFELVGKTGIFALNGDYCFASYLVRLNLDRKKVLPEFLNYFMNSDRFQKSVKEKASKSINQANINATILSNELIRFPESLTEQQRIVGILGEAFNGITSAKANAAQNLQNARALFESRLQSVFTQPGQGWVEKRLVEVCVLQRGLDLPTRSRSSGDYPLVSSSGIIDNHNEGPVKGPGVVTGRSGSIGNVFYIEEDYWPLNTVLYVKEFYGNNPRFVYRLLTHFDLKRFATGAGVPTLNRNFVHDERVVIPKSTRIQKEIGEQLDVLEAETQRLESIYHQKLAALEALKKSLLHQAFSGQL